MFFCYRLGSNFKSYKEYKMAIGCCMALEVFVIVQEVTFCTIGGYGSWEYCVFYVFDEWFLAKK